MLGTRELRTSLAAATRALALRQGLEVHGKGQLLGQRRALPVVPCQHIAHHQPKGHQHHPQGVGQDTLGHKVAVGVPAGVEGDAQASECGWPVPNLAGTPSSSSSSGHTPWERSLSPRSEQEVTARVLLALGRDSRENWGHSPIAGLQAAQHLCCQMCSPRQREVAPGVLHSHVPMVLGLRGTPMCSWGHRRVLQLRGQRPQGHERPRGFLKTPGCREVMVDILSPSPKKAVAGSGPC